MSKVEEVLEVIRTIDLANMTSGEMMLVAGGIGAIGGALFLMIFTIVFAGRKASLVKKIDGEL